ncbi:MAG: serine hydrolase domain-containing protein [Gemmatimonadaceae bacterium]
MLPPLLPAVCSLLLGCSLPRVAPESVGMAADRLAVIDRVVARGVAARGFPGAAVLVGRRGGAVWARGYGHLSWAAGSPAVDPDATVYDLASLTKVVATTTAAMILYDEGRLRLDDPVAKYLPAFAGGAKSRVTVRQLLTHRSGLPAGRGLGRDRHSPAEARRLVLATPLQYAPGARTLYSDAGFEVLGFVVEAAARQPLDAFVEKRVFRPLGMRHTAFRPGAALRLRAAPTEPRRDGGAPLRGVVHDDEAAALGGVAGHAGLFSTAGDLAVFAQMLLDGGTFNGVRIVRDSTVALFTRPGPGWRGLGWETCYGGGSCGQVMGERAFGHTGFTGTSLWIDPDRETFVIVLANWAHTDRDHPTPPPNAVLHDVRADVADVAALSVLDAPGGEGAMPPKLRADLAIGWF